MFLFTGYFMTGYFCLSDLKLTFTLDGFMPVTVDVSQTNGEFTVLLQVTG